MGCYAVDGHLLGSATDLGPVPMTHTGTFSADPAFQRPLERLLVEAEPEGSRSPGGRYVKRTGAEWAGVKWGRVIDGREEIDGREVIDGRESSREF